MKDVCFVSYAFGEIYVQQQRRLRQSIEKIYPEANIMFWTEELPPGARNFYESLYGFKPHAILAAVEAGFPKVIFLDPAMVLADKIDDLFQFPIVAVKDDNKLHKTGDSPLVSNKCLAYYGLTGEMIERYGWHLVGGSLYYFDFTRTKPLRVFQQWMEAEQEGLFGSQKEATTEQINGHRNDETCMALAMYMHGIEPQGAYQVRYCIQDNPMFIKKHFK